MNSNLSNTIKLQQIASNPKNSAWVFASAGSGKTKVLVDRVLRLFLDGIKPDKILCLTFTKVAASEMQNRINSELANWVLLSDKALNEKLFQLTGHRPENKILKKARTLFTQILDEESKIKIQTIHSFCQNLVKIFPFEAGIKPNFEVIEEAQEKLLLQKAQKEVLKRAETQDVLRNIVIKINAKLHEETFAGLISALLNKKEQLAILKENLFGIEGVIDEVFKNFSVVKNSSEEEIFAEFLSTSHVIPSHDGIHGVLKLTTALEESNLVTNKKIATAIKNFLQNPTLKKFSTYHQAFFTKENEPRKISGKVLENPDLARICQDQRKLIIQFLDKLNSHKICNSTALLLKFVDQILEIYAQLKNQNSLLDYNDLIIETNKLLNNPNFSDWVKLKMDGLFDHILIDESQDTNHQQWNIIKSLTEDFFAGLGATNKDRTIFIVGDEKQSIYSFQGAEPNISQEIFSYFSEKLKDHSNKLLKIDLNSSFRSLETVLKVVDKTFEGEKQQLAITKISDFQGHSAIREGIGRFEIWPQIKTKKAEKITILHNFHPERSEGSFEKKLPSQEILHCAQDEGSYYQWEIDFSPQENYYEQEFLAEFIALKIKSLVENGHILEGRNKVVGYGDFMILLRNRTNGLDKNLTKFFHKYNIPSISPSKINFAGNIIIQDLLAAAKFALFPYDDLNLACLLKSPIFSVNEEELFEICLVKNNNQISIYEAIAHLPKFSEATHKLEELIKNSQELNCFEFFNNLLNEDNSRKKIISRFGQESLQILDKFILKTFDFCQNFSTDLHKFLDFVEKLNPEFSLSNSEDNQVLITTIHSAKGLQAPIVILPDCCFNFNQLPSSKEKISWIEFDDYKLPIWCAKKDEENQLLKNHRQEKNNDAKDEYSRLLYVAMTRAENELYVGGFGSSSDEDSWYNLIKKSVIGEAWQEEFLDEKSQELAGDKFEIENVLYGVGEKSKKEILKQVQDDDAIKYDGDITKSDNKEIEYKNFINNKLITKATQSSQVQINQSQIRGKLIHKILEVIGKNSKEDKEWLINLAERIIKNEAFLNKESKIEILEMISKFLLSKQFEDLFSEEIKCEVPIIGEVNNQIINARIDLLVITENSILIIDYKTDKVVPDVISLEYLQQLKIYKKLMKDLYPNHQVGSAILWLESLKLDML